jgi:hypothetical protein
MDQWTKMHYYYYYYYQFLVVEDGVNLKSHFEKLAQQFPLQAFEKSMGDFIQMILGSMDVPALDKVIRYKP